MESGKRQIALVTSLYLQAFELSAYLKSRGLDAVITTRHAVQVVPWDAEAAEVAMREYSGDWRSDGRSIVQQI